MFLPYLVDCGTFTFGLLEEGGSMVLNLRFGCNLGNGRKNTFKGNAVHLQLLRALYLGYG